MLGHEGHGPRAGRVDVERAWAASIVVLGFLLSLWPFVRTPPLDLARTYVHLIAGWTLAVVGLVGMSRSLGPAATRRGDFDD